MWTLRKPLMALSLGLNLAFVTVWLIQPMLTPRAAKDLPRSGDDSAIPSAIHREIGVTEEQWQKIEPLVQGFREKAMAQRQRISDLRGQLMDLLAMPKVDEAAIREKQEEILASQRQMQNLVIDHLLKERQILSPEQTEKFMQSLCEQCRHHGDMPSAHGHSRILMGE
ncbi:MAG: Spy/CpxP family protein refolding chaperone [Desulfuromonadales bacterium]|nr:Spy/CpxP family protein refolding chaperone [Desulfuromonadales bacterium]